MRSDRDRLLDILEATDRIQRYVAEGKEAFYSSELIQIWIAYHLQVIGEAAAKLGAPFRNRHPEVQWAQIIAMRNILVHDYFGVDLAEVWIAAERDVPNLKPQIEAILNEGTDDLL